MKTKYIISIVTVLFMLAIVAGGVLSYVLHDNSSQSTTVTSKNEKTKDKQPSKVMQNNSETSNKLLKKISISYTVDWYAKKDGKTKYIIKVQNRSNQIYSGKIRIKPSTCGIMNAQSIVIDKLLPDEFRLVVSFAELDDSTTFEETISGTFTEFKETAGPSSISLLDIIVYFIH